MSGTIAVALGLIVGSAGAAKLVAPRGSQDADPPSLRQISGTSWRVIGVVELGLGVALVTLRSRLPVLLALGFFVLATAYLALRLAALDRGPCECWGPRHIDLARTTQSTVVREALRPAWYFARNGTLVLAAATALEWSATTTAAAVGTVWFLVATGTLAAMVRLRGQVIP